MIHCYGKSKDCREKYHITCIGMSEKQYIQLTKTDNMRKPRKQWLCDECNPSNKIPQNNKNNNEQSSNKTKEKKMGNIHPLMMKRLFYTKIS